MNTTTENTRKTTTTVDIIMRDTTTETTIMRRSTRITTTESMENMVITITMTVLVQPRKENMNKLPNIAKMVIEGQSLGLI